VTGDDDLVRAVVQRVRGASVTVDGDLVGRLDGDRQGLVVLVGVTHTDTDELAARLAAKVLDLRILDGERSARETGAPVLVVSQFTLYGDTRKGRRPTWNAAAPGPVAEPLVEHVVATLRAAGTEVATGRFGADMALALVNDGPVTLLLDL
jgi:D-aminoacyl-tRNA deacylase